MVASTDVMQMSTSLRAGRQAVTEIILSAAAVMISVVSFAISYLASRSAERRSRMPILVFVYDESNEFWILRNVGNGPALNVLVAEGKADGAWFKPMRVPPLGRHGEVVMTWFQPPSPHRFGAFYTDFLGDEAGRHGRYTVICEHDLNRVRPGRHLPEWPEGDIGRYWDRPMPPADPLSKGVGHLLIGTLRRFVTGASCATANRDPYGERLTDGQESAYHEGNQMG
jgi:hypothetical protein